MLIIRYQRVGRKNRPIFRIVLTDKKRSIKSGRNLEILGFYDPIKKISNIKGDRIKYWKEKGVQISDSVYNFLVSKNIFPGPKKKIKIKQKKSKQNA